MPAKKRKQTDDGLVAETREQHDARNQAWKAYFLKLVEEWRAADSSRLFVSERKLAREIGIDPTSINSWSKGLSHASRDACVRVAQWSGHPVLEVSDAAGWNRQEDSGYQTVDAIITEVKASDWPEDRKAAIIAKLEKSIDPDFKFHPVGIQWTEYITAVYNQRIPRLVKAERAAHFVDLAEADIARANLPNTSGEHYRPHILPNDQTH